MPFLNIPQDIQSEISKIRQAGMIELTKEELRAGMSETVKFAKYFDKIIDACPENIEEINSALQIADHFESHKLTIWLCERALEAHPTINNLRTLASLTYLKQGNLQKTRELLEEFIENTQNPAEIKPTLDRLYTLHYKMEDYSAAAKTMIELHQLQKPTCDTLNKLGTAFYKSGQISNSIDTFLTHEKTFPESAIGPASLAEIYLNAEDYASVYRHIASAKAILKEHPNESVQEDIQRLKTEHRL